MSEDLRGDLSGLPETGRVVVGFSGGADSTALAHWLMGKVAPSRLVLAHVNHMLRGEEADRDEAAARAFAERFSLEFRLLRADVREQARREGEGLEECGRRLRYEFFETLAPREEDRILTAHNAGDNAETMLLNLCRGAGLSGLCGIPYFRGKLLRPFLRVEREEIEAYCAAHGLSYVTDSSNLTGDCSRNRIRREVLPILKELNPRAVEAMGRTAVLLSRDRDLLRRQAEELLKNASTEYGLKVPPMREAEGPLRAMALKLWLEGLGCRDAEQKHLELLESCLLQGGAAALPGGLTVKCSGGLLYVPRREEPEQFSFPLELPEGRSETALPGGKILILEKIEQNDGKSLQKIHSLDFKNSLDCDIIVTGVSGRAGGERPVLTASSCGARGLRSRFSPAGRGVSKPLKQVFRELGVPADRRGDMVLLEIGGEIVFCEGAGAAGPFRATEKTSSVLRVDVLKQGNEK